MTTEEKNASLGDYIRARRRAQNIPSAQRAADLAGVHHSYWTRLEAGEIKSPAPEYLQAIARVLDVPIEDLYALAGYHMPERLPSLRPYLRARYGRELSSTDQAQLEQFFNFLRSQYGIPQGQPVFPPKPKRQDTPADEQPEGRAA